MNTTTTRPSRKQQSGFSLIEVLVALIILAIGLLGLASLQMTSLKFNTDAYLRTQATTLAYDIIDRMRINNAAVLTGSYTVPLNTDADAKLTAYVACKGTTCNCYGSGNCTPTNIALFDLGSWYERLDTALPGASENRATISFGANNTATITINWRERDLPQSQTWVVQLWPF